MAYMRWINKNIRCIEIVFNAVAGDVMIDKQKH